MVVVHSYDAVSAYQLVTRITVEIRVLFRVFGAKQMFFHGRNECCHVPGERVEVDDFV